MGQILLPLYSIVTKLLTPYLGVQKKEGEVIYFHSDMPIFSHHEDDIRKFRYITSNFIAKNMCSISDVSRVFGVSYDSVRRYRKLLETEGEVGFFGPENRHGHWHEMTDKKTQEAQRLSLEGKSQSETARIIGVKEGTIRYWIAKDRLKKR